MEDEMGLFRSTGDNSRANTISDSDWRDLQKRAAKANPDKVVGAGRGSREEMKRGEQNYNQARRGNN